MFESDSTSKIISYINELGEIESELQRSEERFKMAGTNEDSDAMMRCLMEIMSNDKVIEREINIIRKISPHAAQQLDVMLDTYKELQNMIRDKFAKWDRADKDGHVPASILEDLDEHIQDMLMCMDEIREATKLAYNCLAGAAEFIGHCKAKGAPPV